ncbi:hypothetical protein RND81_10G123200 [Saponaria officinalis]|uniref:Ribulose bisphosphate carboxylase small subunit n=1 Tax=Saponaria officinalis TaxID=3572 RepID=A0AAW1I3V4_SAPOF
MASLVSNVAVVATTSSAGQANMVAPFSGLKSTSAFPVSKKNNVDITSLASNGGRVNCMQVYMRRLIRNIRKINNLLVKGWVPCIEFEVGEAFVYRENNRSPGYYDGRYWTMWKLPMFGCTDAAQVEEAKKAYPDAHIRIIGFDNRRQVQCISFIAYKPT